MILLIGEMSLCIICLMNKAVIFDGDGTLWRPIGGDKNLRPDVIYRGGKVEKNSHLRLEIVDGVHEMLFRLRSQGYKIFVVSAHPVPGKGALEELKSKIVGIGIEHLVDGFFCSDGGDKDGKAKVIRDIIVDFGLDKAQTYMVGDSYYYDYEAGKKAGVNSFFVRNDYCKQPFPLPNDVCSIDHITDLVVK